MCFWLMGLLYSRAGYECGRYKRVMEDNNFNWGTFEGHVSYKIHCNAHTNNFVVVPRGRSAFRNVLAALDFDLAFFKRNFVNIRHDADPEKYGKDDDDLFYAYLNIERYNLETSLAGVESMLNFTYSQAKDDDEGEREMKDHEKALYECLNYALRDTAVLHFRKGFLGEEYAYKELYEKMYDGLYDLIELALILTQDVVC
eukprot:TRINITY_DN7484_c0_g2_i3.p1 TRINITY_DN7484_c0_g2~~TRINITY_DN7484_c0_g2_i3.p1  ORF type:complete len:200 (+),score=32.46 TRINITY_DN7484_c0_g2_i3:593-1192(+)